MLTAFLSVIVSIRSWFRTRALLQVEIFALRHQVAVLRRSQRSRLRLNSADRLLWVWLSRLWSQMAFGVAYCEARNGHCLASEGIPSLLGLEEWARTLLLAGPRCVREIRELIRKMSMANSLWGAPRIRGELLKLGIQVSQAAVAKYMVRQPRPPSQRWRTFLNNHVKLLFVTRIFRLLLGTFPASARSSLGVHLVPEGAFRTSKVQLRTCPHCENMAVTIRKSEFTLDQRRAYRYIQQGPGS
jgi:hypothetical protein